MKEAAFAGSDKGGDVQGIMREERLPAGMPEAGGAALRQSGLGPSALFSSTLPVTASTPTS